MPPSPPTAATAPSGARQERHSLEARGCHCPKPDAAVEPFVCKVIFHGISFFVARFASTQASNVAAAVSRASSPCPFRRGPRSQRWPTEVLLLLTFTHPLSVFFASSGAFHGVAEQLPSCATEKAAKRQLRRLSVHAPFL